MKPIYLLLAFVFIACASSSSISYRPKASSDNPWSIEATKTGNSIKVSVNQQTVIDESLGLFAHSGDFSGTFENRKVNVHLVYDSGFLGIGAGWETTIFIDGELAGRFKL